MGKIRKHYSLESGGAIFLDKSIVQRFEAIAIWNMGHIYGVDRDLFIEKYNHIRETQMGWRQKVLDLWPLVKHLNGTGAVGKLFLKEWRVRNGIPWQKSAWISLSRKLRGKLPEKKKKAPPLNLNARMPIPPRIPRRNLVVGGYQPEEAAPPARNPVERFADQLRAYQNFERDVRLPDLPVAAEADNGQNWLNAGQIGILRANIMPNNQWGVEPQNIVPVNDPNREIVAFDGDGEPIYQDIPRELNNDF